MTSAGGRRERPADRMPAGKIPAQAAEYPPAAAPAIPPRPCPRGPSRPEPSEPLAGREGHCAHSRASGRVAEAPPGYPPGAAPRLPQVRRPPGRFNHAVIGERWRVAGPEILPDEAEALLERHDCAF